LHFSEAAGFQTVLEQQCSSTIATFYLLGA